MSVIPAVIKCFIQEEDDSEDDQTTESYYGLMKVFYIAHQVAS